MNTNKRKIESRNSIRLTNYDYSNTGWYYVTVCTKDRKCIFGDIENGKMISNTVGKMVENLWHSLPNHYPVELDTFQNMPNHVHFVIRIVNNRRGLIHQTRPKFGQWMGMINHAPTLGHIIRFFKAKSSRTAGQKLWQRNFWEHVIRTGSDLEKIRIYIKNNPKMWNRDRNNPDNIYFNLCSISR